MLETVCSGCSLLNRQCEYEFDIVIQRTITNGRSGVNPKGRGWTGLSCPGKEIGRRLKGGWARFEFPTGQLRQDPADDDGKLQKSVAALLHKSGYRVSDVEMPGMTGVELAIELNQERPDTKVLLISGLASGMLVLNNGWQFLPKPFMSDMLKDRIRDFLSEQPPIKAHLPDGAI